MENWYFIINIFFKSVIFYGPTYSKENDNKNEVYLNIQQFTLEVKNNKGKEYENVNKNALL